MTIRKFSSLIFAAVFLFVQTVFAAQSPHAASPEEISKIIVPTMNRLTKTQFVEMIRQSLPPDQQEWWENESKNHLRDSKEKLPELSFQKNQYVVAGNENGGILKFQISEGFLRIDGIAHELPKTTSFRDTYIAIHKIVRTSIEKKAHKFSLFQLFLSEANAQTKADRQDASDIFWGAVMTVMGVGCLAAVITGAAAVMGLGGVALFAIGGVVLVALGLYTLAKGLHLGIVKYPDGHMGIELGENKSVPVNELFAKMKVPNANAIAASMEQMSSARLDKLTQLMNQVGSNPVDAALRAAKELSPVIPGAQ